MKQLAILIILLITCHTIWAQNTDSEEDYIFIEEVHPSPEGGMENFFKYIQQNLEYPRRPCNVAGKVFLQFVVETDGRLSNIKVVKGIHPQCDSNAVKVLRQCPIRWQPGQSINGKKVRVKISLPIRFDYLACSRFNRKLSEPTNKPSNSLKFQVYPNPLTTQSKIEFELANSTPLKISLEDNWGQIIWHLAKTFERGKQQIPINLNHCKSGVYILKIYRDKELFVQRLIYN